MIFPINSYYNIICKFSIFLTIFITILTLNAYKSLVTINCRCFLIIMIKLIKYVNKPCIHSQTFLCVLFKIIIKIVHSTIH